MVTYGINGIGRIGKFALKALIKREAKVSWINDSSGTVDLHRHLLEYDSVHGKWDADFSNDEKSITINDKKIIFQTNSTIENIELGDVDIVIDCTGYYKSRSKLLNYFNKGVKKVVVSAPIEDENIANIVYGVNQDIYDSKKYDIVTAASCTTNCLAPIVKVIHENIGIKHGSITTIHNPTNTQTIVDKANKEFRRARSALNSLIPTTTGSAKAITLIYPELLGKLNGQAVRVPLLNSSLTDCVFEVSRKTNKKEINNLLKKASEQELRGILGYEEKPLVSTDYLSDKRSAIIDADCTMVINETQVKIYAWYDNEIGYAERLIDVSQMVGSLL